eukprot:TRINITY_DN3925_c0_g1_i15.p1 TRINITY_DN3925_c0_g1~~TRINITY_DN3925_c0_g1_i15.p1  ORF type:complete len:140 (+),score=29.71 TRINITY_DN3925_c0_g1_i15:55-474(+)
MCIRDSYMECQSKYGGSTAVWEYFTEMFDYLPIAAVIDSEVFCVHGGLSPLIETIKEIEELDRFREIPHEGPFSDLMWSDPDLENPGFTMSSRGAGYLFGEEVVNRFLALNKIEHIVSCLLYTSPSPRDGLLSRMPSSA